MGELINTKVPFVSVPLPTSAENHQLKNAMYYKKKGFGFLVEEKDLDNKLYDLIELIFNDKTIIKNIIANQSQYSDKNVFQNINMYIEKIIDEKN